MSLSSIQIENLRAQLRGVVGQAHVLTEGDLSAWELDWRKRYRGKALAVVRPGTTQEVAQVVTVCSAAGVSLVPQGGNTGLVGGGVPNPSGTQVLLSLQRMQRIRALDRDNLTMTVEAGCILQTVQEQAEQAGLLFPLSLAAEGSCTIGGNLATNAGGTQVLRFGTARDLCLGLEVVTAQGAIWDGLSGLRKDNTGYDLRGLYIGSEGTLGIITAATLKLFPRPAAQMTAWALCRSPADAVSMLNLARHQLGDALTGFECMSDFSMHLVARHFPQLRQPFLRTEGLNTWHILFEMSAETEQRGRETLEHLVVQALERDLVQDAAVATNLEQARHFWHLRECIPLAQAEEGLNIKHDISLPVSAIPAFVVSMATALNEEIPGIRLVVFGHLGDGNLHYNVQAPEGEPPGKFLADQEARINARVYDAVAAAGGSISAEHGIGELKRHELPARKSAVALATMRQIKAALDPQGLLNPGRLLA
jgi:FAD/FMN-containing dehydrogenase